VARWMLIVPDGAPALRVPLPLLVALLACALLVIGGGLVPAWLVDPAFRAVSGF